MERAQQEQPALLCQLPCSAYIKHRSAEDCLLKASAHCKAVQQLLKQAPCAPHLPKPSLRGGLQLCVDLSQAFDRVSRQLVKSSVRSAGYSAEVETALLIWLHGGTFQIEHKGQTAQVPCSRGVKQGSRGGPHMWSLVTRYVLLKLASSRGAGGLEWIQSHILNYADDYHGSWVGHSEISMHQAVREAAEFLSALEDAGLQLNLQKSAAMLKVAGPKERAFYKNYVMRRADGVFLKCSTRSGKTYLVPLVKKWDYLGATLSYVTHAADTVSRRVRAADHAFSKLKQVLGARRSLPIHQRLAVYDACVQSTLVYAVFATGIGASVARMIHYMMMRHLRYIAQSPRHITRESNEQLCQRLGRPLPLATLHHVWEKKCRAWKQRREILGPQDLVLSVPPYPDLLAALNHLIPTGLETVSASTPMWQCPTCRRAFATAKALRTHCARAHSTADVPEAEPCTFQPTRDAKPGTWDCAHCHATFPKYANLAYHIERRACLMFDPRREPAQAPHIARVELQARILHEGLEAVSQDESLCRELIHTCAMCGRHVEHASRMSQHILKCHAQVHALMLPIWNQAQLQFRGYSRSTKCQYCQAQVKMLSQHRCPVLCELACMQACAQNGIVSTHVEKPPRPSRNQAEKHKRKHTASKEEAPVQPAQTPCPQKHELMEEMRSARTARTGGPSGRSADHALEDPIPRAAGLHRFFHCKPSSSSPVGLLVPQQIYPPSTQAPTALPTPQPSAVSSSASRPLQPVDNRPASGQDAAGGPKPYRADECHAAAPAIIPDYRLRTLGPSYGGQARGAPTGGGPAQAGKGPTSPETPGEAGISGCAEPHTDDGPHDAAARGCPQLITPGDGADDLHAKRRRQCSASPHHDLGGVAQADAGSERDLRPGSQGSQSASGSDGPVLLHGARSPIVQGASLGTGGGQAPQGADTPAPLDGGWLDAASVVQREGETGAYVGPSPSLGQGSRSHHGNPNSGADPWLTAPLPCTAAVAQDPGKGWLYGGAMEDGHWPPGGEGQTPIWTHADGVPQRRDTACVDPDPSGQHEALSFGPEAVTSPDGLTGPTLREHMLQWSFSNSSIWCYLNSCVWGLLWGLTFVPNPHKAWGCLREVASDAARTPHGRIKLSQCPSIRGALKRWCTAHARHDQQDGAEFYADVLAHLVEVKRGAWEGRQQSASAEKHDLNSPVLLHMPMMSGTDGQNVPLQSLVLQ